MVILAVGLNHKTAPVEIRERISFGPDILVGALRSLANHAQISEGLILSTCNRTEVYCAVNADGGEAVANWLGHFHGLDQERIAPYLYTRVDRNAVSHLLRVASGLDSMVLGEPQILGQVKTAFHAASDSGTTGKLLGRMFQHAFAVAKQVRTDTAIGNSPVSVAFAAVSLARQIFSDLSEQTALLVGAGETIELAARHLHQHGVGRIVVANRTVERAHGLAAQFDGYAIALTELANHLPEADILIASTASPLPVLGKGTVERALKKRKHRPIFMVDIAVPRDIEPEVGELNDVYLYTVDDLQGVVEEACARAARPPSRPRRSSTSTPRSFSAGCAPWTPSPDPGLPRPGRAAARPGPGQGPAPARRAANPPEEVLGFLAHTLTNKLLHGPSARCARPDGRARTSSWRPPTSSSSSPKVGPSSMNPSIRTSWSGSRTVSSEITALLAEPETRSDQHRFRDLSQGVRPARTGGGAATGAISRSRKRSPAPRRCSRTRRWRTWPGRRSQTPSPARGLEPELKRLLVPPDPNDQRNVFLEIRAGTGGAEAALFAADLARMYLRFAEITGWRVEQMSESAGELGGYKEVVLRISGSGVYSRLKFEAGTHRVQRVPETESQGRIHTSACTVAVLPEAEAIDEVDDQRERPAHRHLPRLRRRRPAREQDRLGGAHHPPALGIVVECQDERSQHKNKARAMSLLQAKLLSQAQSRRSPSRPSRASSRSAAATAPSASAPTTSRRTGSPTTAST